MVETAPVGTRLARVMATDETANSRGRLSFFVEDEEVHNLRSPKRHVVVERHKKEDNRRRGHITV